MLYNNLTQFINNCDEVRAQNPNANLGFTGRLLLPGDTVLVTITTDSAEITINDLPAPTGHPIHELFAREGRILRNEASEDLGRFRQVRVWGRWHDDGSQFQSFEPYITCKIDADGDQTFSRYGYDWFGGGGESCDLVFKPMIRGRLACESIMALTVQISDIFHMPRGSQHLVFPLASFGSRRMKNIGCLFSCWSIPWISLGQGASWRRLRRLLQACFNVDEITAGASVAA